jgi:hypothetical protein
MKTHDPRRFLEPYMPKQCHLIPPWLACLRYCLGQDEMVAAFRQATRNQWSPGITPLDNAIDTATGAGKAFFADFAQWMNDNIWGSVVDEETMREETDGAH